MIEKRLYEIEELRDLVPMSRCGIYQACKKGAIPTVRVGRRVFVPSWWVEQTLNKPSVLCLQA